MTDFKVQAEKILKAYAEDTAGLTRWMLVWEGFTGPQAGVLIEVLGKGVNGEITVEEQVELEKAGFAKEFIQEIAGSDGRKALKQRAKFFSSKIQEHISRLKDKDFNVRYEMVSVLGEIGDVRAVEPLITTLKDEEAGYVRLVAAKSLGQIGDTRAVEPLIAALKDSILVVQIGAAEALTQILIKNSLMALIPYLRDLDQMVAGKDPDCGEACQEAAAKVLQKLEEEMR